MTTPRGLARRAAILLVLIGLCQPAPEAASSARARRPLRVSGHFVQGGLLTGTTEPGAQVTLDGRTLRVGDDGTFVAGFGRDAKATARLVVRLPGGRRLVRVLTIRPRKFRVQRIDHLPEAMVTPPEELQPRIMAEQALLASVRAVDTPEPLFRSGFVWPVRGPISGVYGSRRILNGKPRAVHWGVDIAAETGTPVVAPADAIVLIAQPDLYYTGGTVLLDHGFGLVSAFLHLSGIDVQLGQRVRQGDVVGRVGATGRATGPHLDWRLRWFEVFIDPQLVAGPMAPTRHPRGA